MGRGPVVEGKKNFSNALKQKNFSLHAKLIALAASKGIDPNLNPSLHDAIEKARKDNVPSDNIERAIKKGAGVDKGSEQVSQITYEGYAPGGVAIIIQVLTDNKNRTASNIRHIFSKFGGNMGEPGSVAWIFPKKGVITFDKTTIDETKIEELVFETNVDDMQVNENNIKLICSVENLKSVSDFFKEKGITYEKSNLEYIPNNEVEVTEFDKALKIVKMIEALDEDEDVEDYSLNAVISDELKKEVNDFIEKNTFRT
ncbi:MAG: YebC/PmpR family DNA-binding transcriptional regulator [Candidatus Gracilibacteria bacterium]|nr:YebC/PmpR family DNA-binding transcriptional regulator [Candidatus Gracilibacteria bacterium]